MNLKEKLNKYFELQQQIYDYFGYKGDWHTYPIEDRTKSYWMLANRDKRLVFSPEVFTKASIEDGNKIYSAEVRYKIYKKEDYTCVCADTNCDWNEYLYIFDNTKQCVNDELIELYEDCW